MTVILLKKRKKEDAVFRHLPHFNYINIFICKQPNRLPYHASFNCERHLCFIVNLFNCNTFCQVLRFVNIAASELCNIVRKQLKRHYRKER